MKHDLPSRPRLFLGAAVVLALAGAVVVGVSDGETPRPPAGRVTLAAYDSCDAALSAMKERMLPHVGPYGLGGGRDTRGVPMAGADQGAEGGGARADSAPGAAAPSAKPQDYSGTNNYEPGADEPDLVKTDGKRVVTVAGGVLRVMDVASRKQTAAVRLEGGYGTQLLLSGDRALVMIANDMMRYDGGVVADAPMKRGTPPVKPMPYQSRLVLVDLTGAGTVLGTLDLDGLYLDARQTGTVARVVVRSQPRMEWARPAYDVDETKAVYANRTVVERSTLDQWLPRYRLTVGGATTSGQLPQCANLVHPADYTANAMLTVLTFDLRAALGNGDPLTIVADGDTVYGTGKNLYVADDHAEHTGMADTPTGGANRTELYEFDVSGAGQPKHVASGTVDGTLLNQYSLSEQDGNLRVATTLADQSGTQSAITVLARKGNTLTQIGRVAGLGVGERIYAVRYFGDTAYVVTFRETDPLYTVDLTDPANPRVTGELKITGYSAYLHPAGDGRLIGVGQEATGTGQRTGAQVSLFDTTNASGARRVAQYHLANAWSEVESDPHAFLYWPKDGLLVLPMSGAGTVDPNGNVVDDGSGAVVLRLTGDTFEQVALIDHDGTVPRRALVIGDELWTVSDVGMKVNDIASMSEIAWLPFT